MQTGFIGAGAYWTCPVDGCDWKLNQDQSSKAERYEVRDLTPEGINEGISKVANARAKEMEAVLRDHLDSHDVLDFLRTIQRLNQDLAQFNSGIRPHVYRSQPPGP